MTICPGKSGTSLSFRGEWNRDVVADLAFIKAWNPKVIVTLLEDHEFYELGVSRLPGLIEGAGIEWHHLPIRDGAAPEGLFEERWPVVSSSVLGHLDRGERVLIHCRGGLGRTGTVAAKLLVDSGMEPGKAIRAVRKARKGTIETTCQEDYIRGLNRQKLTGDATDRLVEMVGSLKTGDLQNLGAITVMPLLSGLPERTNYRTAHEAIELDELQVTELDERGSVPRLRVRNRGQLPVLMIGGEELTGVKQNRIINTTIVVSSGSTLQIPVSCTEQGRWSASEERVKASSFMPRSLRLNNKEAIDRTLADGGSYAGHQSAVWDVRFVGENVSGSALLCQDEIVHMSAYATTSAQ
jgi:protein-tyrosine phosphatase